MSSTGFRHEALLYAGEDEFVDGCASFVRCGLEQGEPTLVVVGRRKLDALREALGADAAGVSFADMADVGRNPARIIPAWQEFVLRCGRPGVGLRGIGEPIFPERGVDELVECERHEALLNLAFAGADSFWLVCPYDVDALAPAVIGEARRNHPLVTSGGHCHDSADYRGLEDVAAPFAEPLREPPACAAALDLADTPLELVRRFVSDEAERLGLDRRRSLELVVAVNELAASSPRDGAGRRSLRIWGEGSKVVCELRDRSRLDDPLADRVLPRRGDPTARALWLANQLCDLVQVRTAGDELIVRLHAART